MNNFVSIDDTPNKYFGQSFLGFTWEPSKCLPIFYKWLRENGVTIINKTVSNLEEIEADYIINCTGIGARDLVSDQNVFPISGHVLRYILSIISQLFLCIFDQHYQS